MIIPNHLQIEVVAGMCTADCIMCTIKEVPRKGILEMKKYAMMLKKFLPYISDQQYLTLHGMGEPLLDESLPEKIHLAKQMGFKSIGFATNATHLSKNKTEELLDSGLDTIIFSLDGMTKATHEQIRRGTNFDRIKDNIMFFIDRRNANKKKTKIIVRMIRQAINQKEWDEYKKFWSENLNSEYGDQVSVFDIHNWAVRERERES